MPPHSPEEQLMPYTKDGLSERVTGHASQHGPTSKGEDRPFNPQSKNSSNSASQILSQPPRVVDLHIPYNSIGPMTHENLPEFLSCAMR